MEKKYRMLLIDFNPRSHEGSDDFPYDRLDTKAIFQSSLPRGERHILIATGIYDGNFNPRSHEGSDTSTHYKQYSILRISILAPTRGATLVMLSAYMS